MGEDRLDDAGDTAVFAGNMAAPVGPAPYCNVDYEEALLDNDVSSC